MACRGSILMVAAMLLGGCADASGGRGLPGGSGSGGKADDAEGEGEADDDAAQLAFVEAVGRCEALADRGRATIGAARIEPRLEVEVDRLDCLRSANDEMLAAIEATLEETESPLAGDGEEAFTAWREANAGFCALLVKASEAAIEKDAEVHEAGCVGRAEVLLAEAIVSFADLGGTPAEPPEARDAYADCYEAFDAAIEEADATQPVEGESELDLTIDAHEDLSACIQLATAELDDELAARVVESFPGRGMDNLHEEIDAEFEATEDAATVVCNVLGSASIDAGEPEAQLQAETCAVSAAIWRAELIGALVPELAPEDPEGP
jgi:hypothetical protein